MPRTLAVMLLFSLLAPATAHAGDPPGTAVHIKSFAFDPATIRVKAGSAVEWVNEDEEPHTVTSDDGAFRSAALDTGKKYPFTFQRKGRFPYHCALHPEMTGTVVVE